MEWGYSSRHIVAVAALGSSLAVVACTQSPPIAEMRGARDSIARAAYDGAPDLAAQPFEAAQDKVARAQSGVNDHDMTQAKYLAEEAQADADYADAVSNAAKTRATAMQLQDAQQKRQGKLQ